MSFVATSHDLWYVVASICFILITFFLCWALYVLIKLLRQTDQMVTETRERVNSVEEGVMSIVDKMSSAVGYMGLLVEGGKQLLSIFGGKKKERSGPLSAKGKQKLLQALAEEEE